MTTSHQTSRRYDAVICDIDGCLGPERGTDPLDDARLAEVAVYNRLAHERKDRPVVTLCTGRPQPYAEAIGRLIHTRTLPIVCEMGVWLWWPSTNAFDIDPSITADDLAMVQRVREWVAAEYGPRGVVQQPGKTASISLYHEDTAYLKSLEPELRRAFTERGWGLRVSSTWLWINLDLATISKKTGIARLIGKTGLEKSRLAGIGDTMGDLAIRESVGFFACPANAEPGLQDAADEVSAKHEIEGVLDILSRLVG